MTGATDHNLHKLIQNQCSDYIYNMDAFQCMHGLISKWRQDSFGWYTGNLYTRKNSVTICIELVI